MFESTMPETENTNHHSSKTIPVSDIEGRLGARLEIVDGGRVDISLLPANIEKGILIPLEHSSGHILKKLVSMCRFSFRVKKIRKSLQSRKCDFRIYGLYPSIDQPVYIYELFSAAEKYTDTFLLPMPKNRIKAIIRKLVKVVSCFDLDMAGIAIVFSSGSQ